jgi:AcrR family transcriptional regulator
MPHQAPLQSRSRKTMERLIAATITLLEDHRPGEVSVQDIVTAANSSVGSFYARFKSKEDLLEYVRTRMWMDATERWRSARGARQWDDLDLATLVRGLIRLFDQVEGLHLRARGALGGTSSDPVALAFNREVEAGAVDLLMERGGEIGHPDAARAAHFAVRLCLAVVRQEGALDPGSEAHGADLDELAGAITGYLQGSVSPAPDGEVEFFDIWG